MWREIYGNNLDDCICHVYELESIWLLCKHPGRSIQVGTSRWQTTASSLSYFLDVFYFSKNYCLNVNSSPLDESVRSGRTKQDICYLEKATWPKSGLQSSTVHISCCAERWTPIPLDYHVFVQAQYFFLNDTHIFEHSLQPFITWWLLLYDFIKGTLGRFME